MNESVKAKKASKNGWNGWNGDTINLVGVWVIASIFLTLGATMMISVAFHNDGNVGYVSESFYQTEWANHSHFNYLETVEGYSGGVIWSESNDATGYIVLDTYTSFLLPIRFVIALVFLILGIYAMPKTRRK